MNINQNQAPALALYGTLLLGLTACGGGSGTDSDAMQQDDQMPGPEVEGSGIEGGGVLAQFSAAGDNLIVGDSQLDLSDPNLVITIDDMPGAISDLQVGQQILFSGTTTDGGSTILVNSIVQDDLLEGPVDAGSIDLSAGEFAVLGQLVRISDLTVFDSEIDSGDLSGLSDGAFVEISGQLDTSGTVLASRIDLEDDADEFELNGFVTAVDLAAQTFVIGNLTVDFSAAELEDFDGDPMVGDLVEVEGTQFDGTVLIATEVEREDGDDFEGEDGDFAVIVGPISSIVDSNSFMVAGRLVTTDNATEFDDGTVGDLQVGAFVEVEGVFQSDGSVLAREVEFESADDVDTEFELTGAIEDVDTSNQQLTVLGVNVQINSTTLLVADDDNQLSFADLSIGQRVEVEGFEISEAPGVLQAAKLEVEDDDEEDSVTGPASNIADPMLTIFGVVVTTNSNTEFDDDQTAVQFFASLTDGVFVEAEGIFSGGVLTAEEIELEDDD